MTGNSPKGSVPPPFPRAPIPLSQAELSTLHRSGTFYFALTAYQVRGTSDGLLCHTAWPGVPSLVWKCLTNSYS